MSSADDKQKPEETPAILDSTGRSLRDAIEEAEKEHEAQPGGPRRPPGPDEPVQVTVHSVTIPAPTGDQWKLFNSQMVQIGRHPVTGQPIPQVLMNPDTMVLWLETAYALDARDEKIKALYAEIDDLREALGLAPRDRTPGVSEPEAAPEEGGAEG